MYYDGYLYIIHSNGLFKINKINGEYERIGKSTWRYAIRNCAINFGSDFYVFYENCVFWGSFKNGDSSKVIKSLWKGIIGVFPASSQGFPLTDGYWKKIFHFINPKHEIEDDFKYKIGTTKEDGTEISKELCSVIKRGVVGGTPLFPGTELTNNYKQTMKEFFGIDSLEGKPQSTLSDEAWNNFTKTSLETFSKSKEISRKISVKIGKSIASWQYIFKGQMEGVNLICYSTVFTDTHGEYPTVVN